MDEATSESAVPEETVEPPYLANCDPGDETADVSEPPLAA